MSSGQINFKPPGWMRHGMVQTALASFKFRKNGANPMLDAAEPIVLDCIEAKLLGSYSRHPQNRALVIFLHGWEGSQDSTYVQCGARNLFNHGCSAFRLNFRDHGDSHHLNPGLFYSTNFNEVYNGVAKAAALSDGAPVYLVGFSLGGNFALRIARVLHARPIENLAHVFAISSVIDPWAASPLVDANPLYRRYFLKKWKTSLRKKQALFPDLYDFSDLLTEKRVLGITQKILPRYSEFSNMEDYFNAYKIRKHDLENCPVDLSIISARDDGMIPAGDVESLVLNAKGRKILLDHGGHNGFFQSLTGPTWYDDYLEKVILGHDIC